MSRRADIYYHNKLQHFIIGIFTHRKNNLKEIDPVVNGARLLSRISAQICSNEELILEDVNPESRPKFYPEYYQLC